MSNKGTAQYTAHVAVAVTPQMKERLSAAADFHGVKPAVVLRWAVQEWLNINFSSSEVEK